MSYAVGELWLIAGQSNIAYSLGDLQRKKIRPFSRRASSWLSSTSRHPQLRLFQVQLPGLAPRLALRLAPQLAFWLLVPNFENQRLLDALSVWKFGPKFGLKVR